MKNTGIVRLVDNLGRIVVPKEIRNGLGIEEGNGLEVFVDSDRIVLRKHKPGCVFCGEDDGLREFNGVKVCVDCLKDMGRVG